VTFFSRRPSLIRDFNDWLGEQPYRHKVVIPGNHGSLLELSEYQKQITNAHLLINSGVELDGVKIWGSPVTPYANTAFGIPTAEARRKHWSRIPAGTNVLVTHGPPYWILDCAHGSDDHQGDPELFKAIGQSPPALHVFGHVQAILLMDLVSIIRRVAFPHDEVQTSDANHLTVFCRGIIESGIELSHRRSEESGLNDFIQSVGEDDVDEDGLIEFIEDAKTLELTSLTFLVEAHSDETADLRDRLLAFAIDIGVAQNRGVALRNVIEYIKISATTESQRSDYVDDMGDARYELLGVSPSCSMEELKAAYRLKVALWHPDKLQNMAPELQAMATKQLAKLNEAYQGICVEREKAANG
jgi:DnaJ-domain-containing protein 1